ncbi:MAG TPA: alpha/beta fold hydrolase [Actinocatenispora sp.]
MTGLENVTLGGVRLAVSVSGTAGARPLVLLHGGGNDRTSWAGIGPAFAATHRVYAPDLRGFGDSDRPGRYSFELMRDDVLGLLDAVGAEPVDLVGHSMGGTVAWLVAQARPAAIAHLVVEDTPLPRPGDPPVPVPDRPEGELPFDWAAVDAVMRQLNDPDPAWWRDIPTVTAPTLVLAGGPASHIDQAVLAEAAALLPDSRLVEIPVGHGIHADAPDAFLAQVRPFLAS